jgi:hypothetical protein
VGVGEGLGAPAQCEEENTCEEEDACEGLGAPVQTESRRSFMYTIF